MNENPERDTIGRELRKSHKPSLSLVIPVYKNEENIAELTEALITLCDRLGSGLEIIFVIDGSPDNSGSLLIDARKRIPCPSKIVFHSRNFGAFGAIRTGLEFGDGDYFAAMAADLQEPPELIIAFFDRLSKNEADIVFGERAGRDDPLLRTFASNFFWWVYRRLVLPDVPKGGVDLFGCSRRVRDEVLQISEPNSSLIAQLFWSVSGEASSPMLGASEHMEKALGTPHGAYDI